MVGRVLGKSLGCAHYMHHDKWGGEEGEEEAACPDDVAHTKGEAELATWYMTEVGSLAAHAMHTLGGAMH